jgi:hypothetical protein
MLLAALLTVTSAATTVTLALEPKLECLTQQSLSERLARVGLQVVPQNPPVSDLLTLPAFEVSVKTTPGGLQLTARRTFDGKVFERLVETGKEKEDCPTVERLVVVLIHSWITAKMPVLSPSALDGGAKR